MVPIRAQGFGDMIEHRGLRAGPAHGAVGDQPQIQQNLEIGQDAHKPGTDPRQTVRGHTEAQTVAQPLQMGAGMGRDHDVPSGFELVANGRPRPLKGDRRRPAHRHMIGDVIKRLRRAMTFEIALRGVHAAAHFRRAAEVGSGMYASECYLERHGAPQTLDDVADHVAVGWAAPIAFQWPRTPIGDELKPRRDVMVATHPSAHLEGLRNGLGLGVTSHRLARVSPGLVRILPDFEVLLDLWLVAHGAVRRSRAQATVLDHIAEALRADRDHFRNGEPSRYSKASSRPC